MSKIEKQANKMSCLWLLDHTTIHSFSNMPCIMKVSPHCASTTQLLLKPVTSPPGADNSRALKYLAISMENETLIFTTLSDF